MLDNSLPDESSCTEHRQCEDKLVCADFVCTRGCAHFFRIDECETGKWCKPRKAWDKGECAASECDPLAAEFCSDDITCVGLAETIGACVPSCQYGFAGETYSDSCTDDNLPLACQPLGFDLDPVCLPTGGEGAPGVGQAGCDPIVSPCQEGSICLDVVCRKLCRGGQVDPCAAGESCVALGQRTDVYYCRAD